MQLWLLPVLEIAVVGALPMLAAALGNGTPGTRCRIAAVPALRRLDALRGWRSP